LSAAGKRVKDEEIAKAMEEVITPEEAAHPFVQLGMGIMEKWMREVARKELASFTLRLVQHRFGAIDEPTQERIRALPNHRLEEFGEALLDFASLAELQQWLAERSGELTVG
jgi:hypothetical protein